MRSIRIFRHIDCEGPAYLQTLLEEKNIPIDLVRIDQGDGFTPNPDDIGGLIFMGGSMSVNDPLDWIDDELALIRRAVQDQIPVLGICLGSQLLAKALGARVYPGPCMEIGWYPVTCHNNHALTRGLPSQLEVFHWHGETFELPAQAQLLFSNSRYPHQGFSLGPHLGLQFHFEMQTEQVEEWLQRYSEDLSRSCEQANDAQVIQSDLKQRIATLNQHAQVLLANWLNACKLD